ncbi:DNA sulfur modification protein DndE [Pseudomonas oryzihabitans]|uniref:DNA sulfur modification protein DndE n=1 Tax=Pseudomonas oryzihabitans TaxID=47885 RepID=UPI000945B794|nr:DNA sulfur modification protein DndE [Pseudomonas psychrotolerans]NMY91219.1 DNA sulfur modification protein DndE [Pseudomonas psychrotolerans]
MIDRIRLTAAAKIQLATLKRKTGIEHYNSICRHALCLSLASPSVLPEEDFNFSNGIEIDWRVFTGGYEELYLNLIAIRLVSEGKKVNSECLRKASIAHVHRGLSYLASKNEEFFVSMSGS